mmetsp:Transcript_7216/g.8968  ORF Transcript_7216/g.8968 Transcript_7216/m.8968 type:complete len:117 (-) Transcript_7216:1640-1990(-)
MSHNFPRSRSHTPNCDNADALHLVNTNADFEDNCDRPSISNNHVLNDFNSVYAADNGSVAPHNNNAPTCIHTVKMTPGNTLSMTNKVDVALDDHDMTKKKPHKLTLSAHTPKKDSA